MSIRPCGEIGDTSWAYEESSLNSVKKGLIMHDIVTYILLKGMLYGGVFLLLASLIEYIAFR